MRLVLLSMVWSCGNQGEGVGNDPVDNHPPSAPDIQISPDAPGTLDDLTANLVLPSDDPDGDVISYFVRWTRNGAPVDVLDDTWTVPADLTTRDDRWSVVVRASDGIAESAVTSNGITVVDTPPTLSGSWLNDALTAEVTPFFEAIATDPDGDVHDILYTWRTYFQGWSSEPEIGGMSAGYPLPEGYRVEVTAEVPGFDPPVSIVSSRVVADTPPVLAARPRIVHLRGWGLTSNPQVDDPDEGDEAVRLFEWYVDGVLVSTTTESTDSLNVRPTGQQVEVQVTIWDPAIASQAAPNDSQRSEVYIHGPY